MTARCLAAMNHKSPAKPKSSPAQSIQHWLESPNAHSSIKHARQLMALEQDWQQAAANALSMRPGALRLGQPARPLPSRVATVNNGELVVLVQSAATRAKLQFNSPSLLAALQAKGWQINAVRYQVQATAALPAPARTFAVRTLTAVDADHLMQTSARIQHPGIGHALKRLASRAKPK
jgi:hypothetical protein